MTCSRYAILEKVEKLTEYQKKRTIDRWDIFEAVIFFGYPLAYQLERDHRARYKAWDSFSMILQSRELLPSASDVERFSQWAFVRLGLEP